MYINLYLYANKIIKKLAKLLGQMRYNDGSFKFETNNVPLLLKKRL